MHRNSATKNAGFTLTELMVAMAIFLILMTALVTLFNAAVTSVRQGYASIDAFETGRQATTVMARDLNTAFTSREHGDVYNFYGRPDGMLFVGGLEGGRVGRVTYVAHAAATTNTIRMNYKEKWGVAEANLRRQAQRIARDLGYSGNLVRMMTGGEDTAPFDAGLIGEVQNAYQYFDGTTYRDYLDDEWVDFTIEVEVGRLIRFEEAGVNDLDTFDMRVDGAHTTNPADDRLLDWPYVDPIDPTNDATPLTGDGDQLQDFLLGAVDPTPADSALDLRALFSNINITGGRAHPITGDMLYLRALGRDTFDQLLKARKREFWLRMLGNNIQFDMPWPAVLAPDLSDGALGYWHDEALNGPNARGKRVINEYVVADGIVLRTRLINPATDQPIALPLTPTSGGPTGYAYPDILDAEVKFSYGDGTNPPLHYFNDIQNLRDADNPDGIIPSEPPTSPEYYASIPILLGKDNVYFDVWNFNEADLIEADNALADTMLGNRSSRKLLGSPLAPRIPEVVTVDFWVTRPRTRPGAPDILKRFTQSIQIPVAHGRSSKTTIARSPGASL